MSIGYLNFPISILIFKLKKTYLFYLLPLTFLNIKLNKLTLILEIIQKVVMKKYLRDDLIAIFYNQTMKSNNDWNLLF
jgi:hypothetical protein